VIEPPRRWAPVPLREMWEFRGLFRRFVRRDLTLRYRQTALGVIWVVLQPLLGALVFTFVFHQVAGFHSGEVPYLTFSYAGMVGWTAFNSIVSRGGSSLVSNSALVSKIYFPRLILPLSIAGSALVDFLVGTVVLLILIATQQVAVPLSALTFPLWVAGIFSLGLGVALITGALAVPYRDVNYILPVLLQLLLYATPIAYPVTQIPARFRTVIDLNPLTGLIEGLRWSAVGVRPDHVWSLVWAGAAAVGIAVFGAIFFTRLERNLADVI
jgi:lipopolysaccharide transport system permease protein